MSPGPNDATPFPTRRMSFRLPSPRFVALAGVLASVTSPVVAEDLDPWRFDAALNVFMAGMSGEVVAKGVPAHVDATFKNIFENLEASAAGRFTLGYARWFLTTEFSYLKLGADVSTAEFDMEQWLVEPAIGYTLASSVQVFAGARYNNIDGDITFRGAAGRVEVGTQAWWDPILGANLSLPLLKGCLSLDGHFDVGGFGAASDLTWQAFPYVNWRFARWGSAQLGYRWFGTDYETGSGVNRFRYDVVLQGPQIGLTAHF